VSYSPAIAWVRTFVAANTQRERGAMRRATVTGNDYGLGRILIDGCPRMPPQLTKPR